MMVNMNVFNQLEFCVRWTDHQDLLGTLKRFCDRVIIDFVLGLTSSAYRTTFGVQMCVGLGRVNDGFFNVIGTDVHDMGL